MLDKKNAVLQGLEKVSMLVPIFGSKNGIFALFPKACRLIVLSNSFAVLQEMSVANGADFYSL